MLNKVQKTLKNPPFSFQEVADVDSKLLKCRATSEKNLLECSYTVTLTPHLLIHIQRQLMKILDSPRSFPPARERIRSVTKDVYSI